MLSLIVGLGNIGKRFQKTRHNVGFDVVDTIIKNFRPIAKSTEVDSETYTIKSNDNEIVLAKPTTMMNGSGGAVLALLDNLNLSPSEMLVVSDDFNIPLGAIRIRTGGSDGGHNGLESIIEALDTEEFPRLRLGIGPVPEKDEIVDFVLGKFTKTEAKTAKKVIELSAEAVIFAAGHRLEETMSKYNYNPV